MNLRFHSHSEADTIRLGTALSRLLQPGDVVTLHGDLGAGKTRLVRGVAVGLGIPTDAVSSPTYVIAQEYHAPSLAGQPVLRLVHIDAYRLRGEDELETVGWDLLTQPVSSDDTPPILIVEWAERIPVVLSRFANRADVTLSHAGDAARLGEADSPGERVIDLTLPDSWRARPGFAGLEALAPVDHTPCPASGPDRPATRCRVTGKPVPADSATYPFFDEKARLADLNRWFTGGYAVSRELTPDDADDPEALST